MHTNVLASIQAARAKNHKVCDPIRTVTAVQTVQYKMFMLHYCQADALKNKKVCINNGKVC